MLKRGTGGEQSHHETVKETYMVASAAQVVMPSRAPDIAFEARSIDVSAVSSDTSEGIEPIKLQRASDSACHTQHVHAGG